MSQWSKVKENVLWIRTIYLGALPCPSRSYNTAIGAHPKTTHVFFWKFSLQKSWKFPVKIAKTWPFFWLNLAPPLTLRVGWAGSSQKNVHWGFAIRILTRMSILIFHRPRRVGGSNFRKMFFGYGRFVFSAGSCPFFFIIPDRLVLGQGTFSLNIDHC